MGFEPAKTLLLPRAMLTIAQVRCRESDVRGGCGVIGQLNASRVS